MKVCGNYLLTAGFQKAKGNFQADAQEDFKDYCWKTGARGYLYERGYGEEDRKCLQEECEAAPAAAAERQAQSVGEDDDLSRLQLE